MRRSVRARQTESRVIAVKATHCKVVTRIEVELEEGIVCKLLRFPRRTSTSRECFLMAMSRFGEPLEAEFQLERLTIGESKRGCRPVLTFSLPRVINFRFLLQPHQKYYITKYEELGFSKLTQMKDDYTTNSYYLTHTFLYRKFGRMYFFELGSEY